MKGRTTTDRRQLTYRIRWVLAFIAVVPLIGAGWFAFGDVIAANQERDRADELRDSVRELVALAELQTRLLEERNWVGAEIGLEQLGLAPIFVTTLTGIDVSNERRQASAQVDALVDEVSLRSISAELEVLRRPTSESLSDTGDRYQAMADRVGSDAERVLDRLLLDANSTPDGGSITIGLRVLEASVTARAAISAEFNSYFGAQFSDQSDRLDEIELLIAERSRRQIALAEIRRLSPPGSAARASADAIGSATAPDAFDQAVAGLVNDTLRDRSATPTVEAVLGDLDGVARTFEASSATTALYLDLVEAAGDDIFEASQLARERAIERTVTAITTLLVLGVVSVGTAWAANRAIARPVTLLADAARRIGHSNGTELEGEISGPIEIKEVSAAINQAALHMSLAERQALALANGDLQHESLRQSATGSLGASLQNAVRTLATSMHQREEYRQRMTYEATHDGLTQLPNRTASMRQLENGLARADRSPALIAALFIDLDGFKDVNDRHGHPAGDAVLRIVAQRLTSVIRNGDHVGRLGGDEFLVLAESVANESEAKKFAGRLRATIRQPITIDVGVLSVDASIGIALSGSGHDDANAMLRDADLAVYHAKHQGRGRIEVFSDALLAAARERADLEDAIQTAITDDQFVLHYQPIIQPGFEVPVGFEALIRWHRPGYGLVSPDEFIPFAERSNLIIDIDKWVLRNVAKQIVGWDTTHGRTGQPISVNLSGRHLSSPDFVDNVCRVLDDYRIEPSQLIIEITESALLDDLGTAASKLERLRQRGIRIAIDDFGTGYTSLAHLKSLPIDILKIDRSFTNDRSAASLVQLIIDTGHLLGATITAEGIETQDQADLLTNMGSDDLQGFLYGRPSPAEEIRPPAVLAPGNDASKELTAPPGI